MLVCQGFICLGRLAQWLERLLHTQEVRGSTPRPPTINLGTKLGYWASPQGSPNSPNLQFDLQFREKVFPGRSGK
jgi:hypothetical protein